MNVARARLLRDITVKQLIHDLAAAWEDDERGVLELVGELLENHEANAKSLNA